MKEEINLLPPYAKQSRAARLRRSRLLYLVRRAVLMWLVAGAILVGAFVFFHYQRVTFERQLARQQVERDNTDQVKRINESIRGVARFVEEHPAWTPVLPEVVNAAPEPVRLEVIALQADGKSLLVKGVTSSRTAVVDMQRELEALPFFSAVEAPLQNFAAGEKSEFSFTLHREEKPHETSQP